MSYRGIISLMPKTPAFDADALAFITAATITDGTQKNAINTLVLDLKSNSLWTKMKALYPFVGGTATAHKFNLKDPRDLDAAFRLDINGGYTHTSLGLVAGINSYCDTHFVPSVSGLLDSMSFGVYSQTTAADLGEEMGCQSGQYSNLRLSIGGFTQGGINEVSTFMNVAAQPTLGLYFANRPASNVTNIWRQGVKITNTSNLSVALPTVSFYIGVRNGSGVPVGNYSAKTLSLSFISEGLNDTESMNFSNIITTYQTALSRQI